jgi:hypothetical protein
MWMFAEVKVCRLHCRDTQRKGHSGLLVLDASQGEHHPQLEPMLLFKLSVLKFGLLVMTGTLLEKVHSYNTIIKHHIIS